MDLQIELTDYCNVKCIYCSQHMDTGVHPGYKKGMMSYSNFKKIIVNKKNYINLKIINFYNYFKNS